MQYAGSLGREKVTNAMVGQTTKQRSMESAIERLVDIAQGMEAVAQRISEATNRANGGLRDGAAGGIAPTPVRSGYVGQLDDLADRMNNALDFARRELGELESSI